MKSWDSVPTAGRLRLQKRNKMRKSSKNVRKKQLSVTVSALTMTFFFGCCSDVRVLGCSGDIRSDRGPGVLGRKKEIKCLNQVKTLKSFLTQLSVTVSALTMTCFFLVQLG